MLASCFNKLKFHGVKDLHYLFVCFIFISCWHTKRKAVMRATGISFWQTNRYVRFYNNTVLLSCCTLPPLQEHWLNNCLPGCGELQLHCNVDVLRQIACLYTQTHTTDGSLAGKREWKENRCLGENDELILNYIRNLLQGGISHHTRCLIVFLQSYWGIVVCVRVCLF